MGTVSIYGIKCTTALSSTSSIQTSPSSLQGTLNTIKLTFLRLFTYIPSLLCLRIRLPRHPMILRIFTSLFQLYSLVETCCTGATRAQSLPIYHTLLTFPHLSSVLAHNRIATVFALVWVCITLGLVPLYHFQAVYNEDCGIPGALPAGSERLRPVRQESWIRLQVRLPGLHPLQLDTRLSKEL